MEERDFVYRLKEALSNYPGFRSHRSDVSIHCPSCERDRSPSRHGHFYISLVKKHHPGECKKCPLTIGGMNLDFLSRIGIDDIDIKTHVAKEIGKRHFSNLVNINERDKKINFVVNKKPYRKYEFDKLNFLHNRTGVDFINDLEKIETYRVVTSLRAFMKDNNIDINDPNLKFDREKLQNLEMDYVGFLSYYGNIIQFRNIRENENKKLSHDRLIVNTEIKRGFIYVPKIQFDPIASKPNIVISEGPIDIMSLHNKSGSGTDVIYAASTSKGGISRCIKTILDLSGYYGATIHLYLDNDEKVDRMEDFDYRPVMDYMKDYMDSFHVIVHLNLNGKDFSDASEDDIIFGVADLNKIYLSKRRMSDVSSDE